MSDSYPDTSRKADYVRDKLRSGRSQGHGCHWPGCEAKVAPAAWGCKRHWYMLPKELRYRIWRTFRPGQERTKTPSPEYIEAARAVQEWIAANYPPVQQGALEL